MKHKVQTSMVSDTFNTIDVHDHVCMVYKNQEEQFAVVSRFMKIGLARREKCICIADENNIEVVLKYMKQMGINTDYAINAGSLSVISSRDSYLEQGCFDPDRMIHAIKGASDDARAAGFKALRVIGDMSWALGDYPGVERLLEYEATVDGLFQDNNILAVCHYDCSRFSPELIQNMMNIHPCCWF